MVDIPNKEIKMVLNFDCNYIITGWIGFRQIDKENL